MEDKGQVGREGIPHSVHQTELYYILEVGREVCAAGFFTSGSRGRVFAAVFESVG